MGQKCPECGRLPRAARLRGRPRQYAKGFAAGGAAAGLLALLLGFFLANFLSIIAAGFAGWAVGQVVRWGAEGNSADPFRYGALGLAVVMVAVGWAFAGGGFNPARIGAALTGGALQPVFGLLTYVAAGWGALLAFR